MNWRLLPELTWSGPICTSLAHAADWGTWTPSRKVSSIVLMCFQKGIMRPRIWFIHWIPTPGPNRTDFTCFQQGFMWPKASPQGFLPTLVEKVPAGQNKQRVSDDRVAPAHQIKIYTHLLFQHHLSPRALQSKRDGFLASVAGNITGAMQKNWNAHAAGWWWRGRGKRGYFKRQKRKCGVGKGGRRLLAQGEGKRGQWAE